MGTPEQNKDAAGALVYAFEQGVISGAPLLPPIVNWNVEQLRRFEPAGALATLSKYPAERRRNDRITDQLADTARDTRAQEYQDSSFFIKNDPQTTPFLAFQAYEIARFVTKHNTAGAVKLVWTYAEVAGEDPGSIVQLDWLDPFAVQRAMNMQMDLGWFVRLVQGNFENEIPAPWFGPYWQAPGYGTARLQDWTDYRFQWGRATDETFLLVPENHALSLFVRFGAAVDRRLNRVGGRLVGYTQPARCKSAGYNVSHNYS